MSLTKNYRHNIGLRDDPFYNRNLLINLLKTNKDVIKNQITVSKLKKKNAQEVLYISKRKAIQLMDIIGILKIDQYYHKLIRSFSYLIYEIYYKIGSINFSKHRKLKNDYKNGSNNIITHFADNISLTIDGFCIPPGMEDLPGKRFRHTLNKIKNHYGDNSMYGQKIKIKKNRGLNSRSKSTTNKTIW